MQAMRLEQHIRMNAIGRNIDNDNGILPASFQEVAARSEKQQGERK
jgi:hypothetical protein